jgi:hypothetical protein
MTERFEPGGVLHALASGLLELALAAILLAVSLLLDGSDGVVASLLAAAVLWAVLALYSLITALLRARVLAAELDDEAVVLHGVGATRRYRYGDLSAVEVSRGRTRLVGRDGRARTVRGVRGLAQGNRFRARVLARATEAARGDAAAGEAGRSGFSGARPPSPAAPALGPDSGDAGDTPDTLPNAEEDEKPEGS